MSQSEDEIEDGEGDGWSVVHIWAVGGVDCGGGGDQGWFKHGPEGRGKGEGEGKVPKTKQQFPTIPMIIGEHHYCRRRRRRRRSHGETDHGPGRREDNYPD